MRVDDEAIGTFDPGEEMAHTWGCQSRATVCAVDVHPDAEPLRHLGDARQVVDNAHIRSARRRHHRKYVT